ncbi:toll/interleukin-1 receptor domain-containing protein [Streptomyces aquilus]|uniref:Toll/interleukin-1 receptor domain-containing protein n=1 Tax=Streptomyces aquilus TaxID=2548456 RepID=A0A3S9HUT0_9ACTN|nr:FxSxx-COOH system tetratricopeptide repeat protein [Streptomyces aquilus]AZP15844.1 toll/interleukin-1 receptor domain-containing protein [Streptomyces aquilus]
MISDLLPLLAWGGVDDPTPEELADILWLAQRVLTRDHRAPAQADTRADADPPSPPLPVPEQPAGPEPQNAEPHRSRQEAPSSDGEPVLDLHLPTNVPESPGEAPTGTALDVPAAASLPNTLALARALKPLTRKVASRTVFELDEEATVTRLVDEHILLPVLRPAPTRWLSLALVVDCGPSMSLWRDEVHEVQHDVVRLGAFRDIRRWNLFPSPDGTTVGLRPHPAADRPARHPREVVDPAGDQLILVLSDTVGAMWRSGAAHRLLTDWARHSQVAVVHLLPAALWNRVGMTPSPTLVHIPRLGLPNSQWQVADPERPPAEGVPMGVPVPVVELEPGPLRGWAEMTAGSGRWARSSALLLPGVPTGAPPRPFTRRAPVTARDTIRRFRASSSPAAWRLAGLLSARSTLTVPMARLVQRALLRDSSRGDLAEVFLGGILRRVVEPEGAHMGGLLTFEFQPEVREALLGAQFRDDVEAVRELVRAEVTAYLKPRFGSPRSVKGAVTGVAGRGAAVRVDGEAIATASRADVARMGASSETEEAAAGSTPTLVISHAGADRVWAEWVGRQLERAGYAVRLALWDPGAQEDLVEQMNALFRGGHAVLALFSPAYFRWRRWNDAETAGVLGEEGRFASVMVEGVRSLSEDLRRQVRASLHGLDEGAAAAAVVTAAKGLVARAFPAPTAPSQPAFPDSTPRVWRNVPPRNPHFAGREELLREVRENLADGHGGRAHALHGIVGVGKTEIASEYVHRFASQYEIVWWVDAQLDRLPLQFAELAHRLVSPAPLDDSIKTAALAGLHHLRTRERWLIVLDNADDPELLDGWVPFGGGHVLITSRNPSWQALGSGSAVEVLPRADSCRCLQSLDPRLADDQASAIADTLGDLPLALAQAAQVLTEGMSARQYLALIRKNATPVMKQGASARNPETLVRILDTLIAGLASEHPEAADLLRLTAYFAAAPIPLDWLGAVSGQVRTLQRRGLADGDGPLLRIHTLTRRYLRHRITKTEAAELRSRVTTILAGVDPGDPDDPVSWTGWAVLQPHRTGRPAADVTELFDRPGPLIASVRYLLRTGQVREAVKVCAKFHSRCSGTLGADHPDTLAWVTYLARATTMSGACEEGRQLHEQVRQQRIRILGEDHPDTLTTTHDLANALIALGHYAKARRLHNDTLRRRRRVLGEDHPDTLTSANSLANALRGLGKQPEARRLLEDTLERRRRLLGMHHLDTLTTASNLANSLRGLGDLDEARRLHEEVLGLRRRVLGEDHPATIASAHHLGVTLYRLQLHDDAEALLKETLERCELTLGADHPSTASTKKALITVFMATDRRDEVHALLGPTASLTPPSR